MAQDLHSRSAAPAAVLAEAYEVLKDRGVARDTIGGIADNFDRAAQIASLMLNKQVTARDVSMILAANKLARIAANPSQPDEYVDTVNYVAISAAFSKPEERGKTQGRPETAEAVERAILRPADPSKGLRPTFLPNNGGLVSNPPDKLG